MNEPVEMAFTVQDENPGDVTVEASSSDIALVAEADMQVLGGGTRSSARTLTTRTPTPPTSTSSSHLLTP